MVAVVVMGRDEGHHRGKDLALDAQLLQQCGVIPGQGRELAGAVVHHPDVHALRGFLRQDLEDPTPHQAFVDDEILEKDVPFRLFQLAQQCGKLGLAAGEVGHLRVLPHRETAASAVQISGQPCGLRVLLLQPAEGLPLLRQMGAGLALQLQQPLLEQIVPKIAFDVKEEGHAHHRQHRDDHQPCDLHAVVQIAAEQVEHHPGGQ